MRPCRAFAGSVGIAASRVGRRDGSWTSGQGTSPIGAVVSSTRVPTPTAGARRPRRHSGTGAVPRQKSRGQAPSTTSDPAEQAHAGDGKQRPLVPRSRCSPRLMRGVGQQTLKPQETKAKRTPCYPLSLATPRPHRPAQARGSRCPRRQVVSKNTVGTHRPWSVLWPSANALAYCQCPAHGRCAGPWSVLWPIVSARPSASAPAQCQYSAQCRDSNAWPVPSPWSVLWRMVSVRPVVGAQAQCWYSGAWPVLRPLVGTHNPLSVLRLMVGTPADCRDSGPWSVLKPMVGTQTAQPRTGAQHHAILGPTKQWSGLEKSWRFFPAAHRWRSASSFQIMGRRQLVESR